MTTPVRPGRASPLGATPDQHGTNFAVSSGGDRVTLCLFDAAGTETRIVLPERDGDVHHGYVAGVGPGQAYGFRVDGPFDRSRGLCYNPAKLLLDPYARAIHGHVRFGPEVLGYAIETPSVPSALDSAPFVPRSLVAAAGPPRTTGPGHALADTVLYEVHVRGFTAAHPGVPEALRGTYAGLAHEAAIGHLVDLGVTTVELLPVHHNVPESFLIERGLTNYWGYNTIGFFAPHAAYSAAVRAGRPGGQVGEFRAMVDALHAAGIEVVLDVVFNHTAEGGPGGPTLCFRGLDNAAYYRLDPADPSRYLDTTGTGNSVNTADGATLRMVMDSLRYWVTEMGVDGYRFDLAPTLGREADDRFDPFSAFFDVVGQDPVVSQVKLIAEPWDVGRYDSYGVGRFPPLWSEWNGRYRDTVRDWWRSHDGLLPDFASRLCGSADIYDRPEDGRRPTASINFVTVHDGFTLSDLVSYNGKHNEANGEGNRDGTDDNRSWNCGAEGPTDDPDVRALRARQQRAFLVTLLLSAGVPLLLGGDELGRTQRGNNNAYCQDNEITWFDWSAIDTDLLRFTKDVIALRRKHPVFRRRRFSAGSGGSDLRWFTPAGTEMTQANWADPEARSFALFIDGATDPDVSADGVPLLDDDFLLLVNGWWEPLTFELPADYGAHRWEVVCSTFDPAERDTVAGPTTVGPRSVVVLRSAR
ncbi:glycogen debranching protein GlgX [Mycolicibacterium sp. CBMA 226]|uniref:glycogen debranching protein GlgX n=1 Tax=Mycolicibacterium sp. CBMA 226 TaxID=2606611 RepID=UPI0012DBF438|nr:glycogen debranching protein GlgX [Mycolicibacterium sp. CBMA 226]MUL80149.1 glycogen debranching protein GlgX [Mycolicibacterium sp. CBMA 226]